MQISIRALKANPSYAVALAQQGERVEITSHRNVVAELIAPRKPRLKSQAPASLSKEQALQRIAAAGLSLDTASKPFVLPKAISFGEAITKKTRVKSVSQLVIEGRGAR